MHDKEIVEKILFIKIIKMKIFNEIKRLSILFIICLSTCLVTAQSNSNEANQKENIQAKKVAFFTSKMNLTAEESIVFWPLVNEMDSELKDLRNKDAHGKMILKDDKVEDLSDRELEEVLDARMLMGKKQIDIKIKYHEKFKEVIPIQKVAKFYRAKREFKKIQSERKKQHNKPGERPGNRK